MKIIFLDIDGVLNNAKSNEESLTFPCIDEVNLRHLKHVIEATSARVVLTSTWKEDYQENEAVRRFLDDRVPIYGVTEDRILDRGKGILAYLSAHPEVKSYVILDDELFNYVECELMDYLVRTFYDCGLTETDAERAIRILGRLN